MLAQAGYTVLGASSSDDATKVLLREPVDLVLLCSRVKMDWCSFDRREHRSKLIVIILLAYGTVCTAVEAMHVACGLSAQSTRKGVS